MVIRSSQNERFKSWKKLLTKKGRKQQAAFLVEGEHLVEEALLAGWPILELIQAEHYSLPKSWLEKIASIEKKSVICSSLFKELSETESPQGIALKIGFPQLPSMSELLSESSFLLLIDGVQDPGNLGTIIRTADAAGLDGILLGKGTVDPFSGKVLRATQGSIFHIPIMDIELSQVIPQLVQAGWKVCATALQGASDYRTVRADAGDKLALIVGNEGQGIAQDLLDIVKCKIKIPIWGKAESLNVSIATGILLYHFQTQRRV